MTGLERAARGRVSGDEPLPGYRLIGPLGRGGFGEVWKCEVPGGLLKAIKFIAGNPLAPTSVASAAGQELQALQLIKAIRHPFILSLERVEVQGGELLIVMELADRSLSDRVLECQGQNLPGIPRDELLCYLLEAAEALDVMNFEHGLQHLDVKPSNLFVVGNHIKVADFGLVNAADAGGSQMPHGVTPLYASPELLQHRVSRFCDQYSLALVYQDLLTGAPPFRGIHFNELMMQHLMAEPDLEPLPQADRPAVARALSKEPAERFPSCLDFVRALVGGSGSALHLLRPRQMSAGAPGGETPRETANRSVTDTTLRTGPVDRHTPLAAAYSVPGHRLVKFLAGGSLFTAYEVEAEDGRRRIARFLAGRANSARMAALSRIRHPGVMPFEVVRGSDARAVYLTDLPGPSLRDRFEELVGEGHYGIPRGELLEHLGAAADVLDALAEQHGVAHLALTPAHLLPDARRLRVAEPGLVQLAQACGAEGGPRAAGPYSAPELAQGKPAPTSDQYSLAMIFAELLTGMLPRPHRADKRGGRVRRKLDLDAVPAHDRAALARALDPNPARRFPSCGELIEALEDASPKPGEEIAEGELPPVAPRGPARSDAPPRVEELVSGWIVAGTGGRALRSLGRFSYLMLSEGALETRFPVRVVDVLPIKLAAFRQACGAKVARHTNSELVLHLEGPQTFWQRLRGQPAGIEVAIRLDPPRRPGGWHNILVRVAVFGGERLEGIDFEDVARGLLQQLAEQLKDSLEQRASTRWPCDFPLEVYPVSSGGCIGEPLAATAVDLSLGGIRFLVAGPLGARCAYVTPHVGPGNDWMLLAKILQGSPAADSGQYLSAAFVAPRS